MTVEDIIAKAHKMVEGSKTDEQLKVSSRFIQFIKARYPQSDVSELERALKLKDLELHKY